MKKIHAISLCVLLLTAPGCATVDQNSSSINPTTEDMTWYQKTGYYVGWTFLCALYGFAQSGESFSP